MEQVGKAIAQGPVRRGHGWAFRLPMPAPDNLDAELCFAFSGQPELDFRLSFQDASVIMEPGSGDPRDTINGPVCAFLDFFANRCSAQALFLEREWQLGNGAGREEGDLDEIRDYLWELEKLLCAPYELTPVISGHVRAAAARIGKEFAVENRSDLTPDIFEKKFVRAGTPVVMRGAVETNWWRFDRLREMFSGVFTHLSRYPNCSYAIDECIDRIISGDPGAFKAALPVTAGLRLHYSVEDFFPAEAVFQKSQALLIAPADHKMGGSYRATSWHRDWADNLLTNLIGQKRVRIASPLEEERFALQTVPPCHYNVGVDHSPVDPRDRHACAEMTIVDVVLSPGDILFIPCGWLHTVENLTATAAINCWRVSPPEMLDV